MPAGKQGQVGEYAVATFRRKVAYQKIGHQKVGNLSPKGCNGWVCYSSCTRLVFNFHLQTGASRLSP
ncbi:MAG: hypothetical protein LBG58_00685 [Planctomycetaceae bacterium]|nr:hypothetical protein [Planctomycetaceae bacterium]